MAPSNIKKERNVYLKAKLIYDAQDKLKSVSEKKNVREVQLTYVLFNDVKQFSLVYHEF